jgi:hypothetical protein
VTYELYTYTPEGKLQFFVQFDGNSFDEHEIISIDFHHEGGDMWLPIELEHFKKDHKDELKMIEAKIEKYFSDEPENLTDLPSISRRSN